MKGKIGGAVGVDIKRDGQRGIGPDHPRDPQVKTGRIGLGRVLLKRQLRGRCIGLLGEISDG